MASRGITLADWESWKTFIYDLYIIKGLTLPEVVREIRLRYGVEPSKRQCKQRIKTWQFDCKTISKRIWVALHVVDSHHQQRYKYEIRRRQGHQTLVKRPEDIRKQMARYKNDSPDTLVMSLADAQQILDQLRVRVIDTHDTPQALSAAAEDEDDNMADLSSDSPDSGNESSTVNQFSMLHVVSAQPSPSDEGHGHGDSPRVNFSPEHRLAPLNMSSLSAYKDGLTSSGSNDAEGSFYRNPQLDGSSKEILDFTAELSAIDATYSGYINYQRTQGSMSDTNEGAKHDALHFVSVYMRNSAPENKLSFIHNDEHQDREFARDLLQHMLHRDNLHLPGALNYLTMIMHANANFLMYFTFLHDSWNVIKSDPAISETVLATFIVFLCKFAGNDLELARTMSHTQLRLKEWSQQILTPDHFRNNLLRVIGVFTRDSSPTIIMRYQFAWSLLQAGQDKESDRYALKMLTATVNLSQRVLGGKHLITINGLAMRSRALERFHRNSEAAEMYEDCITRLNGVAEPLMPYRVRMQARLARVYTRQSNLKGAETILERALDWRKGHFGMLSPRTWDIVEDLTEVYRQMHGEGHAKTFMLEQQELHNAAFWSKREPRARERREQQSHIAYTPESPTSYSSESSPSFRAYGRPDAASSSSSGMNFTAFGRL